MYSIGTILPATESRNVEYKTGGGNYPLKVLPSHIQKYGSAFLNSDGGTLYVGISDDGRVVGLRLTHPDRQLVSGMIINEFNHFTPPVGGDLYMINFVPCNRNDHFVIEIHVKAGVPSEIYADRENKMWIRRDGSVQGPLWPREIREIVTTKFMKELADSSKTGKTSSTRPLVALSTATPVTQHHQRMT
ncbi:Schlafen-like protein 1 [Geodia barretti]|uniref:Schlafen-like protein 1 n=2 Tax=Geodia barretti TaxID=519541 RepID=A0AA35S5Y5_GEOBA|nr:Schlafen-like protein 1 [Geodia barretti]